MFKHTVHDVCGFSWIEARRFAPLCHRLTEEAGSAGFPKNYFGAKEFNLTARKHTATPVLCVSAPFFTQPPCCACFLNSTVFFLLPSHSVSTILRFFIAPKCRLQMTMSRAQKNSKETLSKENRALVTHVRELLDSNEFEARKLCAKFKFNKEIVHLHLMNLLTGLYFIGLA